MSRRTFRSGAARPPRRWAVFSLAALAVLGAAAWLAPTVLVLTSLRDRPLQALLAGIAGSVESRAAHWTWLRGITYRDIVVRDVAGRAVAIVPDLVIDKGLLGLALDPRDIGTVRLAGVELLVEVRRDGSSLEDLFRPWLASRDPAGSVPACEVEVVEGAVECIDLEREDAWRVSDLLAAGTLRSDGSLAGWTVAGRLRHAGQGGRMPDTAAARPDDPDAAPRGFLGWPRLGFSGSPRLGFSGSPRLDRTTIAANATAVLAREGGWSISSPESSAGSAPESAPRGAAAGLRTVAIASHRLPLGFTSLLATRFQTSHLLDGLADIRLDIGLVDSTGTVRELTGSLAVERLAVCRSDTLAELVAIDRCEVPIDLVVRAGDIEVRTLQVKSPLFRGEAAGRIRLPDGDSWRWADELVAEDFMIAADVDLAAAARALVGGLAVRPDVRVTGGRLEVTASSRADGADRVLEMRVAARDLAAVQSVVTDATGGGGERQLRWNDPFAAWLRGRRPPGRTGRFRIEEARVASASIELSAVGTAAESTVQWTIDLAKLRSEAGEVLDLGGLALEGLARGRLEITGGGPRDPSLLQARAELADFACLVPGQPEWRDESITLDVDATGRFAGGATGLVDPFLLETAHAVIVAADDRLEATLTGGVLLDAVAVLTGGGAGVAPAPAADAVAADCSLTGDLARWQSRLSGLLPRDSNAGITLGGRIQAAAAVAARQGIWQISRASTEVEKLSWSIAGRTQREPRLVATAAGVVTPARGRVEISSAELLTSTLSLRTGGLVWQPRGPSAADVVADLRGRVQWQAEVGRLAHWFLPSETAAAWPVAGRAWGTCELLDTPAGVNLLVEATGSQLTLARGGKSAAGQPPLWAEPRAAVTLELTRQPAAAAVPERVRIDRLSVESSTLALAAQGGVGDAASRRMLELEGTVSYDWEQLSRLLVPWTAGRVRLAGTGGRPFMFRTPLAEAAGVPATPTTAGPQLPAAAAVRGLGLDTSIAWQAADVAGFEIGPGEMAVRLLEGQLAFGPLDVAVSGGRLRGAPWISLVGGPRELVVPPGRILDRVAIDGPQGHAWITWLSPLLGRTTAASGVVSVDVAGARVPLAEPFTGELAGQVLFENFEVAPSPLMQPLVNLIVKLQSVIDPRFAFGDKAVLLRVQPDPVRVRLTGGRLWHEGLVMDSGQLVVKSGGSVAADGALAMTVEVAFRGDIAGQAPVIAQLLRTPLSIPLTGTIERPQFDARALEQILGRVVENTAQAVINDGVGRGLEALFGNPQPVVGGQRLVLPPQPR